MNEQLPISLPTQLELQLSLPERAQRIRDLVGTARLCIIEIGRELIAAKAQVGHGDWLPWLEAEFGWPERTAQDYMRVGKVFGQIREARAFDGLTIDATALYALSADGVPGEARETAVASAEKGEHITKAKAEEMVKDAIVKSAEEAFKRAEAERDIVIDGAIAQARKEFAKDKKTLLAEIQRLTAEREKAPSVTAVADHLKQALGSEALSPKHWRLLAQLFGQAISVGGRRYLPISAAEERQNEENLRISSSVMEAIQALAGAPPADVLLKACMWGQRETIRDLIEGVETWIEQCKVGLANYSTDEGRG